MMSLCSQCSMFFCRKQPVELYGTNLKNEILQPNKVLRCAKNVKKGFILEKNIELGLDNAVFWV